mgnify:CR=1 FL=1
MDTPRVIITKTNDRKMSDLFLGDVFLRPNNQDYFLLVYTPDKNQYAYLCLRDYRVFKCSSDDKTIVEYVGHMEVLSD